MKRIKFIIFLIVFVIVGVTFAFFSNTNTFNNLFKTTSYGTSVTDVFVSPDNWTPGTTTTKQVIVNNEGSGDIAVRLSYVEQWSSGDTVIDNVINDIPAVIINRTNVSNWIKDGNYYYYYKRLKTNESTTSFMDSVTFNSEIEGGYGCISGSDYLYGVSNSEDQVHCVYGLGPYNGSTYNLSFNIETIQYDAYEKVWETSVEIE